MESLRSLKGLLDSHSLEFLAAALMVAFAAFALSLISLIKLGILLRPLQRIRKEGSKSDYLPALIKSTQGNSALIEKLYETIGELREEHKGSFGHFGLVRYDAFDDIGGKQSYSLCMLDGNRNGYIITYLTSKNFARSYAVRINEGEHSRELSDEEMQAYSEAASSLS